MNGVGGKESLMHSLKFEDSCEKFCDEFIAIEVSEDLLNDLKISKMGTIIGRDDDATVLCTDKRTFKLKNVGTSNSILVVDDQPNSDQNSHLKPPTSKIVGVYSSMLLLDETTPSIQKLIDILSEYSYKGPGNEKNCIGKVLSFDQLLERMLCSKFELLDLLYQADALCIGGMWRLIDEVYISACAVQISTLIDEKKLDFTQLSLKQVKNDLVDLYPKFITEHTLTKCSKTTDQQTGLCSINESILAQFVAMYILNAPKIMVLDQFYAAWQSLLPLGIQAKSEYLYGVAFENIDENYVKYLPKSALKKDLAERINQLFEINTKWLKTQMEPYILDVIETSDNVERVFSKYCNKYIDENNQVYLIKKTNKSFSLT